MNHAHKFTACLVAGGQSSRMRRDKAFIDFGGLPLWRHQLQTLAALKPDEILISGRNEAEYAASGCPVVADDFKNGGPLAGIAALLAHASHPLVLILAVDMPFMMDDYLEMLIQQCSRGCGAVPECDGFYEGLAAVFPKTALPLAEAALQKSDRSIQRFVRECAVRNLVRIIPVTEKAFSLFQSLNSPSDFENVRQTEIRKLPANHANKISME